jgi:hypothetical protein
MGGTMLSGQWKMYVEEGKWRWRHEKSPEEEVVSATAFERYTDCLADAIDNGYVLLDFSVSRPEVWFYP